jgi:hypothetical protein
MFGKDAHYFAGGNKIEAKRTDALEPTELHILIVRGNSGECDDFLCVHTNQLQADRKYPYIR